jgi:hypothetical protein
MHVALFITATGKYTKFLPNLINTAEKYFLPSIQKVYYIFTDNPEAYKTDFSACVLFVETKHHEWPYSTMLRSLNYWKMLARYKGTRFYSHAFAIDADAYFASEIKPEDILADSVGVQHCRYVNLTGEFETNPNSACYIPRFGVPDDIDIATVKHPPIYYGGGFYGGTVENFQKINEWMMLNMQWNTKTLKQDIIPKWHDESALNKYFFDHPPALTLSPAYHWPEYENDAELNPFVERLWNEQRDYLLSRFNQTLPIIPKIILIDKNRGKSNAADELRSNK